jgi:hypothetical protein
LEERLHGMQEVEGSIPFASTTAVAVQRGCRSDPRHPLGLSGEAQVATLVAVFSVRTRFMLDTVAPVAG